MSASTAGAWRPQVGDNVTLVREVSFLAEDAGAHPGTIGTVVEQSALHHDDRGVLVDWGNGSPGRCNLSELTPVSVADPVLEAGQEPCPVSSEVPPHVVHVGTVHATLGRTCPGLDQATFPVWLAEHDAALRARVRSERDRVEEGLTRMQVLTRHPQDYTLHNAADGTSWRIEDGMWVRA